MTAKITKTCVVSPRYGIGTICSFDKEKDALTGELRYTYCGLEKHYKAFKKHFDFSPSTFISLDGRAADTMRDIDYDRLQGIFNVGAAHYSEDAAIRKNIALIRMFLYTQYFPDCEFDYGKKEHRYAQKYLNDIGIAIARIYEEELQARIPKNIISSGKDQPFAERRFGDLGKEHVGAYVLYQRLLERQNQRTLNPVRWMQGKTYAEDWGLPPIEESPFRMRDIEEAISHDTILTEIGVANARASLVADALWTFEANYTLAHAASKPEKLSDAEAEKAVILAKHIIDELKKMKFTPSDQEMDSIELRDKHLKEAQFEAELCMVYQKIILDLAAHDPIALAGDPAFAMAQEAIGKIGYLTVQKAKEEAYRVSDADLAHKLMKEERNIPEAYKNVTAKDEIKIIQQIEFAIKEAVRYRDQKTRTHVLKHAGVQLSPDAAKAIQQDMLTMRSRIDNTSAYIAGVSTTRANWAIHAAEAINNEKAIQAEQKQMLLQRPAPQMMQNESRQIAESALHGEASRGDAQKQLLEKRQRQQQQQQHFADPVLQRN